MTRKFQPRLQCIQSATGENLTEAAHIADKWKGYCEDLCHDEEGNGTEQEYWEKEPPPIRSEVARAIRQTASRKATGPDDVPAELFKAGGETALDRMHRIYVWRSGMVSGQRIGRSPHSSCKAVTGLATFSARIVIYLKERKKERKSIYIAPFCTKVQW